MRSKQRARTPISSVRLSGSASIVWSEKRCVAACASICRGWVSARANSIARTSASMLEISTIADNAAAQQVGADQHIGKWPGQAQHDKAVAVRCAERPANERDHLACRLLRLRQAVQQHVAFRLLE